MDIRYRRGLRSTNNFRLTLISAAFLLSFCLAANAVPRQLNYQGFLTRPNGTPLDTTVAMTLRLYNGPDGSAAQLWSEIRPTVTVQAGLLNVLLGAVQPLPDSVFAKDSLYLGVTIGNNSEMNPRSIVSSAAYARRVGTLDGATGGAVKGSVSIGDSCVASGSTSVAFGAGSSATGQVSFAAGYLCQAQAALGIAMGRSSIASGFGSAVFGGSYNHSDSQYGVIASGYMNRTSQTGTFSTIANGYGNLIENSFGFIGGGQHNRVGGMYATVLNGGDADSTRGNSANGDYSVVLGGSNCHVSGNYSIAYGRDCGATGSGIFAFADGAGGAFVPGISNTFNARAIGGVRFYTNADLTAGARLAAGGSTWLSVSDSTLKRNRRRVDTQDILRKVAALPIEQWSYESQSPDVEHIGPMAQDFWRLFHVGDDSLTISTIDPSGIALAAIQALQEDNAQLRARLEQTETRLQALTSEFMKFSNDRSNIR